MSIYSCSLGALILLEEAEAAGVKPAPKGAKTAKHSELVCALDLTDVALLVYFSCCAKSQVVQMSYANCRRTAFGTILHRSAC